MKNTLLILSLILAVAGISVSCKGPDAEKKAQKISTKLQKKLKLDTTQTEKLEKVKTKFIAAWQKQKNNKEALHTDVKKIVMSDSIKEEDVKSLLDNKRNDMDSLLTDVLPEIIEFHASLNSEQKEKIVKWISKFKDKKRGFYHH
jgi:hypothetical protein